MSTQKDEIEIFDPKPPQDLKIIEGFAKRLSDKLEQDLDQSKLSDVLKKAMRKNTQKFIAAMIEGMKDEKCYRKMGEAQDTYLQMIHGLQKVALPTSRKDHIKNTCIQTCAVLFSGLALSLLSPEILPIVFMVTIIIVSISSLRGLVKLCCPGATQPKEVIDTGSEIYRFFSFPKYVDYLLERHRQVMTPETWKDKGVNMANKALAFFEQPEEGLVPKIEDFVKKEEKALREEKNEALLYAAQTFVV